MDARAAIEQAKARGDRAFFERALDESRGAKSLLQTLELLGRLWHFFYGEADFLALPSQAAAPASDGATPVEPAPAEPAKEAIHGAAD